MCYDVHFRKISSTSEALAQNTYKLGVDHDYRFSHKVLDPDQVHDHAERHKVKAYTEQLRHIADTSAPKDDGELETVIRQLGLIYGNAVAVLHHYPDHRHPYIRKLKEAYIEVLIKIISKASTVVNLMPHQIFEHYRAQIQPFAQLYGHSNGEASCWLSGLSITDVLVTDELLRGIRRASRRAYLSIRSEVIFRFGPSIPEFIQDRLKNVAYYLLQTRLDAQTCLLSAGQTMNIQLDFRDLEGLDIGIYRFSCLKGADDNQINKLYDNRTGRVDYEVGIEYLGEVGLDENAIGEPDDGSMQELLGKYQLVIIDKPARADKKRLANYLFKAWSSEEKQLLIKGLRSLPPKILGSIRGTQFLRCRKSEEKGDAARTNHDLMGHRTIILYDLAFSDLLNKSRPGRALTKSFYRSLFHEIAHMVEADILMPGGQPVDENSPISNKITPSGNGLLKIETGFLIQEVGWGDIEAVRAAVSDGLLPPDSLEWQVLFDNFIKLYLKDPEKFSAEGGVSLKNIFNHLFKMLGEIYEMSGNSEIVNAKTLYGKLSSHSLSTQSEEGLGKIITTAFDQFKRTVIESGSQEAQRLWLKYLVSKDFKDIYQKSPEKYPHIGKRINKLVDTYDDQSFRYASGYRFVGNSSDYHESGVTEYGKKSWAEHFAETLSLGLLDFETLKEINGVLAEWIKEHYL